MTPTQLFLASRRAARAGNAAEAASLRAQYLAATKANRVVSFWLESASASVMADYINGDVVTVPAKES